MFKFFGDSRRGSAMMQVLVLGSIIASIVVLLLRFSVTRTVNIVKTRRIVAAKAYAEGCMAQFTAAAMLRELHGRPPNIPVALTPAVQLMTRFATDADIGQQNCSIVLTNSAAANPTVKPMQFEMLNQSYITSGPPPALSSMMIQVPRRIARVTIDIDHADQLN